ncbi:protein kinase domain-containing protein [Demequina activiva]|uniref:non-specific serine/threonine protein kinase n=1 Tax=Demequina activiva TaxID=1582364 RepID=A0A919UKS8_9MICO|nr:hypothetical protein [Demequina activiva]GIG55571.1 hypothetical protein Dac01nite_23230 [Demequina activiva]
MTSARETEPTRRTLLRSLGRGDDVLARAQSRAGALAQLAHPAVLTASSVHAGADGEVVVAVPRIDAIDLAELASRRRPLALEECVWLGAKIGEALEAMHGSGLVHGDVAPANVLLTGDGVMLVDTMSAMLEHESGTPGFRAPERREGATAPGDIYALGMLLRWCATEDASTRIEAWTAPMLVRDPSRRPPAQVAVRALRRCGPAGPVALPVSEDVVASTRARVREQTERIAQGRPWRVRRWVLRGAAGVVVAACAVGIVVAVPRAVDAALPDPTAGSTSVATDGRSERPVSVSARGERTESASVSGERPDAVGTALSMTQARFEALATGDPAALREISAEGAVADQLSDLAHQLEARALRFEGLELTALEATVVEATDTHATASVDYEVSDHRVVDRGTAVEREGYAQSVTMELRWEDGWVLSSVSERG